MIKNFIDAPKKYEKIIVGVLWNKPDNYESIKNHNITQDTFSSGALFALYTIGKEMFNKGINKFDETTVNAFLSDRKKLEDIFDKCQGFKTINKLKNNISKETDIEYPLQEVMKYEALRGLYSQGMINDKSLNEEDHKGETLLNKFDKMSLEQLQNYFEYRTSIPCSNSRSYKWRL